MNAPAATSVMTGSGPGAWLQRASGWLSLLPVAYLLYWGWQHRVQYYLTPEEGIGYALGIAGASLMLLLLLYPLRKRATWMRNWGAVRHWFRMHMAFGVAGPLAILYHCNFQLGATNSNVALLSMLVVAGSGFIGRVLYARIHQGLYGRQLSLDELRRDWESARQQMVDSPTGLADIESLLSRYEAPLQAAYRGTLAAVALLLVSGWRRWQIARRASRWSRQHGAAYVVLQHLLAQRLRRAAAVYRFNAYERLFALWHLLHLPLFIMLVVTGIIHVVAVHVY